MYPLPAGGLVHVRGFAACCCFVSDKAAAQALFKVIVTKLCEVPWLHPAEAIIQLPETG